MLHKESAIAVMVAVMLGAASLLGGLSMAPALATHNPDNPDAIEIASETITPEDGSMVVDAIELTADKSSRASGTITIELIQDSVLRSATLSASSLETSSETFEVDVSNINVTGSFEILVEYMGSGRITVDDVGVVQGTLVAEDEDGGNGDGDTTDEGDSGNGDGGSSEQVPLENTIATKTITPEDEEGMTVDTVEFAADRSSRASGILTVAIVQNDEVLDSDAFRTGAIETSSTDLEASFDVEVTGAFQVVFMYEGDGRVTIAEINVPGTTTPAADGGNGGTTNPDGTVELIVEAVDQDGVNIEGLWVALLNGGNQMTAKGFTEINSTFTLEADKSYIVEMGDFFNEDTQTAYDFQGWVDSANDNTRRSANPADFENNQDTFTALYTVTTGSGPPPGDDGGEPSEPSDPGSSDPGTITIFAHRIPSEHWGPTFTSANAEMYFVVYNSTGWIVYSGFFDENGHVITGLNEGETYWLSPTDCDECHNDPHDVVFDHWEDNTTERQRPTTTGMSAHAYYLYDPDP